MLLKDSFLTGADSTFQTRAQVACIGIGMLSESYLTTAFSNRTGVIENLSPTESGERVVAVTSKADSPTERGKLISELSVIEEFPK